jgi:hypothetical protein
MNAALAFCAYMTFVYMPFDFLVKPVAHDEEVWLGLRLHGFAAKATEPLHWAIYAAGLYGFWRMRPWMWPWAAVYTAQIAVGMLVWSAVYVGSASGWALGGVAFLAFAALAAGLWRERARFQPLRERDALAARYGGWAVVTGASAGIGAEFARQLAAAGLPCVLVARREERLRELARELEFAHGVETRVVVCDLASDDGPARLAETVSDLDVGVLVNNAGFGYAGRFENQEPARLREMVILNCVAPTVLTSLLLPSLRARGRGALVFTGSIAGRQPLPLHAVYAATKGFDLFLGEALWAELQGSGIDVLVLEPGSTESEFHDVAGELPHAGQPANEVVRAALEALGGPPSLIARWRDWLRANALRIAPRSTVALLARGAIEGQTPPERR